MSDAPLAVCRSDGAPLVSTFAFRGYEFICLECGRKYGWLDPEAVEATPELNERHEALRAEWVEHAGAKLLTSGSRHRDCEKCAGGEFHLDHATPEEHEAHDRALAWLAERTGARA